MFDHAKDAVKVYDGDLPHIEQRDENGEIQHYTNADYDQIAKKWIPEPKLISEKEKIAQLEGNVEKLLHQAIPMLEKLMPIANAIEEFSYKAAKIRREKDEKYQKMCGEVGWLKKQLNEHEDEGKILDLKRQMTELETERENKKKKKVK